MSQAKVCSFLMVAIALASVIVLGSRLGSRWGDPWEAGLGGVNAGAYLGYSARAYRDTGFFTYGGLPSILYHPDEAGLTTPNIHHPALPFLIYGTGFHYLGQNEGALRTISYFAMALLLVVLALHARRYGGVSLAAATLAVLCATPIFTHFGRMIDCITLATFTLTLTICLWTRCRNVQASQPTSPPLRAVLAGSAFLNAMIDWSGYGAAPLVLLDAILSKRAGRGLRVRRALLYVGLPQTLGLAVHFAWLLNAPLPDGFDMAEELRLLVAGPEQHQGLSPSDWAPTLGTWMTQGFGYPVLLLMILGAIMPFVDAAGGRPAARTGFLLLGAGALPSIVFWRHAIVHDYWPVTMAPGIALLAGIGACALLARASRAGRFALVLTILGFAALIAVTSRQAGELLRFTDTDVFPTRAAALSEHLRPDDLVLHPDGLSALRYYVAPPMIPYVNSRQALDETLTRFKGHLGRVGRVIIFCPREEIEASGWLLQIPRASWKPIHMADTDAILVELRPEDWR